VVYLTFPDCVHRVPLAAPDRAADELVRLMARQRNLPGGAEIELRQLAIQTVDSALELGAVLLAMVTPDGADAALLTGVAVDLPLSWNLDRLDLLGYAIANLAGGPPVRDTLELDTALGPALLAQRSPSAGQVRTGEYRTVVLQGFVVDPVSERMLLLTLAGPSMHGWEIHQRLFAGIITSAAPAVTTDTDDFTPETFRVS
jgi:hypothetical protein